MDEPRYEHPEGEERRWTSLEVVGAHPGQPTPEARFAAAVAEFGLLLRDSPHQGRANWAEVAALASASSGDDAYRREFLEWVKQARGL